MAFISDGKLVSFKSAHYPKTVILYALYFYVRVSVSYRDLEEIMAEPGVTEAHATLNRWAEKCAGAIADDGPSSEETNKPVLADGRNLYQD